MIAATFKFYVEGDSYEELISKAEIVLSDLLEVPVEKALESVTLEISIVENEAFEDSDMMYAAEMIARLKNAR
jgi:hypothetical protein